MNKEIFIHTGMHKSGSSYLQNQIFPRIPDYKIISFYKKSPSTNPVIEFFLLPSAIKQSKKKEFKEKIDRYIQSITEKKIIISSEELNGQPLRGFEDNTENIYYLSYFFEKPKILLITRKPLNYLESLYRHQVRIKKQSFSFEEFLTNQIQVEKLDYDHFYRNYSKYFPENDILFLPYELMKKDRKRFLKIIFDFLESNSLEGIPEKNIYKNRSLSSPAIWLIRTRDSFPLLFSLLFAHFYLYMFLLKILSFLLKRSLFKDIIVKSQKKFELKFLLRNVFDNIIYIKGKVSTPRQERFINSKQKTTSF